MPQLFFNIYLLSPITFQTLFVFYPVNSLKKSLNDEIYEFIMSFILVELFFYINHYTFHKVPWLYKNFHKQHHEIKDVLGIGAIYCSSVEHIFINLFPFLLSHAIYSNSAIHSITMMLFGLSNTILNSHTDKTCAHSRHHINFNTDYGTFGILDFICGTNS